MFYYMNTIKTIRPVNYSQSIPNSLSSSSIFYIFYIEVYILPSRPQPFSNKYFNLLYASAVWKLMKYYYTQIASIQTLQKESGLNQTISSAQYNPHYNPIYKGYFFLCSFQNVNFYIVFIRQFILYNLIVYLLKV